MSTEEHEIVITKENALALVQTLLLPMQFIYKESRKRKLNPFPFSSSDAEHNNSLLSRIEGMSSLAISQAVDLGREGK